MVPDTVKTKLRQLLRCFYAPRQSIRAVGAYHLAATPIVQGHLENQMGSSLGTVQVCTAAYKVISAATCGQASSFHLPAPKAPMNVRRGCIQRDLAGTFQSRRLSPNIRPHEHFEECRLSWLEEVFWHAGRLPAVQWNLSNPFVAGRARGIDSNRLQPPPPQHR